MLILDRKIAELHRKHNEFMMPSLLLWQGKSRNVTVELNTTHKPIPNHRPLLQGQSEYANYHNQKVSEWPKLQRQSKKFYLHLLCL
jgi:hypothetical protein